MERFTTHRAEFELLVEMRIEDVAEGKGPGFATTYFFAEGEYDPRWGLTRERWNQYQRLMKRVGVLGIGGGDGHVTFRTDYVVETEKGFIFSEEGIPAPRLTFDELDSFRSSEATRTTDHGDYMGYRELAPHWFLWVHLF